jgi:predicted amidohydrolase YtcJ
MIRNLLRVALFFFLLCGVTANAQTLALVGGSVYASPDATPIPDAVVLTSGGVITAIGRRSEVHIPGDARVIDCTGKTVVAGFWNSHVHFTQEPWRTGRVTRRTHARDADQMGFYNRMGSRVRPERHAGAAPPHLSE